MKTKLLTCIICIFIISSYANADGFIIVHPPLDKPMIGSFPLEIKYHVVDVKIADEISFTSIDQVFYNPSGSRLEGTYIFPVPKGAVIKKFSMTIDGKEVQAEFLDAKKARTIYEEIVRKQKDPAILEYIGNDMFRIRVYPIEPQSEKRLRISYDEVLAKDNGTFEYKYPLNTEKFSASPLQEVKISVNLNSVHSLNNIYSTSHNVEINRTSDKTAAATYSEKNVKPETDFSLYFNTSGSNIGLSCLSYKDANDEDGYFLMNLNPSFDIKNDDIEPKNITFVLDTSGSMAGGKLDQAKKAIMFCLENLNDNDGFEIVRFSTEAEPLFGKIEKKSASTLMKAKNFVNTMKPIGGTNVEEAMDLALKGYVNSGISGMIIFITDGKPTIGETDETKLLKLIDIAFQFKIHSFFNIG